MTTIGTTGSVGPLGGKLPKENLEAQKKLTPDLGAALANNDVKNLAPGEQEPLNANNLDYSNFAKDDRARAADTVRAILDRVNDEVREHNHDFPANPYILDESSCPNPAEYTKAKYGDKDEAFHAWKADVEAWLNDRLDELKKAETKGEEAMHNQQMQAIYQLWGQFGVTQQMLNSYCQMTNQSLMQLGNITVAKANEIIAVVGNSTEYLASKIDNTTGFIVGQIHNAENNIISDLETPDTGSGIDNSTEELPDTGETLPENGGGGGTAQLPPNTRIGEPWEEFTE